LEIEPEPDVFSEPFALTGFSRAFAIAGEPAFDLTVSGTGFTSATHVNVTALHAA
jgi:hypothetical protein